MIDDAEMSVGAFALAMFAAAVCLAFVVAAVFVVWRLYA